MTTTSARPAFDDALRHYAATLGFPSLSSYIIWCRKNGLALQRDKTENQLAIERQLARHYGDWLRPVEDWRTDLLSPRAQFRSLTRHLLSRYEVPPFMDTAFLQGDLSTAHREQEWFKHIGIGQNIRKADLPLRLTKRRAHLLPTANRRWPVSRALRWAQFAGMGGRTCWAVLSTRLKDYQRDEPFWETVMLFFANQPMLEPTYIGPISTICGNRRASCACGWNARICGTTSEAVCAGGRRNREEG